MSGWPKAQPSHTTQCCPEPLPPLLPWDITLDGHSILRLHSPCGQYPWWAVQPVAKPKPHAHTGYLWPLLALRQGWEGWVGP